MSEPTPTLTPTPVTEECVTLTSNALVDAAGVVSFARQGIPLIEETAQAARRFWRLLQAASEEATVEQLLGHAYNLHVRVERGGKVDHERAGSALLLASGWPGIPVWALRELLEGHGVVGKDAAGRTVTVTRQPRVPAPGNTP